MKQITINNNNYNVTEIELKEKKIGSLRLLDFVANNPIFNNKIVQLFELEPINIKYDTSEEINYYICESIRDQIFDLLKSNLYYCNELDLYVIANTGYLYSTVTTEIKINTIEGKEILKYTNYNYYY